MISKFKRINHKGTKLRLLLVCLLLTVGGLLYAFQHTSQTKDGSASHYTTVRKTSSRGVDLLDRDSRFMATEIYSEYKSALEINPPDLDNVKTKDFEKVINERNTGGVIDEYATSTQATTSILQNNATLKKYNSKNLQTSKLPISTIDTETEKDFLTRMEKRMKKRRNHLLATCQKLGKYIVGGKSFKATGSRLRPS